MKKILYCTFVVGLMLAVAGTTYAKPSGEVKASPLFHQSLDQTIARMEEPVKLAEAGAQLNPNMATQGICPMRPYTQVSTCSDTWCGTCAGNSTCSSTCSGQSTCSSTCANTCNQNTCASTCQGVVCQAYVQGTVWYYNTLNQQCTYWDVNTTVVNFGYPDNKQRSFNPTTGYYKQACAVVAEYINAWGYEHGQFLDSSLYWKPDQSNAPNGTVTVDIYCGKGY
jgi:hypothetical protein